MNLFRLRFFILSCLLLFFGCTEKQQEQIEDLIPELSPVYEVYQGSEKVMTVTLDEIINPSAQEDWEVLNLTFGETLTFKDVSTEGEPTGRTWVLNGNQEEINTSEAVVTVTYNVEGEHLAGEVTFIREGTDHPDATIQTEIPLKVNVAVPELLPAFKIMYGDVVLYELKEGETVPEDKQGWVDVELLEGESLSFMNTSNVDLYTSTYWLIDGITEDSVKGDNVTVTFETAGDYSTHQLVIERKDAQYPDLKTTLEIPVNVQVIEDIPDPLTAGVKVYLSTDLTTPLYEIEDGQEGEIQNLELEEGTSLVFEALATEGSTLEWSIDNGEAQKGSTSSFEVLFDTPQDALTSHSLTLTKEGHENVEIDIPLTITVNEEIPDPLTAGIKVYLSTDLTTPLYEIEDGQEGENENLELEEGTSLVFEAVATEGSTLEWSIDNGEAQTGSTSSFEVLFDTPQEALTSHSLTLTKEGHETVEIEIPLTITVNQIVPELLPAFTVMYADQLVYELKEGEEIPENQEQWVTVELKEGEVLTLTNNTNTELYTDTYWMLDGVEEETLEGKTVEAVFKTEGEYSVHELVIERKDSNYPDLTEKVVIPVKVNVIKAEQPPKPSAIQVFLAEDLETPIYEIEADKVGESKSIAVENGTSLVFKTMASEGVELAWSVNNGAPQTATTASFEVLFEQDNPSLSGHKLTLSKEGFEDVIVQIPLAIEVFTSEELQVAFSIYKNDDLSTPIHTLNVGEEEVSKVIEISEGDRLTFVDQSTGQSTGRTWKINNGVTEVTSNEASFEVMYATTGSDLSIALMVERKEHEKFKDASLDYSSKATVDVKQVQNEATVKVGKVMDSGSGVIYFETSHDIASFTSADVLNDFTVGIQNIEANYSTDNATISEVKVAEGNNKRIEIYLVENYFNSDDITVGYAGDKIQSALGVPLSNFIAENVAMNGVVSYMDVPMSGFETAAAEETPNEALGWYVSLKNPKETEKIERVTTTASTGNASMHFSFDLNGSGTRSHKFNTSKANNSFALEEGEYEMSIDVFIPQASSTIDIIRTNISTNDDTVDQDVFVNVPWDFSEFPNMKYGEWVTLRQRISLKTIAYGAIKMNFKENDMKLDGLHDFYLDNIQLRKVEARQ